jgi:hypothetical protein
MVRTRLVYAVVVFVSLALLMPSSAAAQANCAGVAAWTPGTAYAVGSQVTYSSHLYRCLQAHTAQVGWEPSSTPALWTDLGACGGSVTPTATSTATATATTATATATRANATATATSSATNLAQGKSASASSLESASYPAANAVDGNTGTRWSSAFSDPQWIAVDLGATASISRVVLNWEAAYATAYQVQVSNDNASWTTIKSVTGGDGGIDDWTVSGSGRYVRIYGTTRATVYGYSLWELQVYGTGGATPTATSATATATRTATATATRTATPTPPSGHNMEITTWVPSYNQATWMAALQANTGGTYNPRNTLTRLAAQMFQVQANGTVVQGVADSDVQWVQNYTKTNNIKFLICVHDYTSNWDWATAASAFGSNQTTLVNSIANLVTKWGAAGVDIDFEGNFAGDPNRTEYGAFIRALGARLHSMGKELTVDIFPYIWNQPNMNWIGDWVGYVDGVNSMGYDSIYGGGTSWQAYSWQQDTVLAAGYKTYQFQMGMPGWVGSWGSGGLGTSAIAHINELNSGSYNRLPTSIAIWDGQFNGAGWLSADVWSGLHTMRMKTGN